MKEATKIASNAMETYDKNGDGKISMRESLAMLKASFETLQGQEKIPAYVEWNEKVFESLFKHADADNSGYIDEDEIVMFWKDFLGRYSKNIFCSQCNKVFETNQKKWVCQTAKCATSYCKKCGPVK